MANKKIIDLTAAGAFGLTDVLEIDTGAASLKITGQQIYNLIAATLNTTNPVTLGNGSALVTNTAVNLGPGLAFLNYDGSASFSNGIVVFNAVGTAIFANGASAITFDSAGTASFGGGVSVINSDGSATWGNDLNFDLGFGPVIRSPNTTLWRVVVDNAGALSTVAV